MIFTHTYTLNCKTIKLKKEQQKLMENSQLKNVVEVCKSVGECAQLCVFFWLYFIFVDVDALTLLLAVVLFVFRFSFLLLFLFTCSKIVKFLHMQML